MSTKQRETLLSKWSDINEFHGEAWLSLVQDCGVKRFEVRGVPKQVQDRAFKWPIINIEDLKVGNSLLSFLEARATQAPYLFIRHDANTIEMFVKKLFIDLPWLSSHSMYFPRHEDREYYGILISDPDMRRTSEEMWAAEKNAKEKKGEPSENEYYEAMYVMGIPARYGIPAMEIQSEIYGFLLTMCNAILQAPVEEDCQYELPEEDELHPLVRLYSQNQYYPAGTVDIDPLLELLTAHRDNIANEIISMKEDPNYFHEYIKEWSEYQTEKIPGPTGNEIGVKKGQRKEYNARCLGEMIAELITDYMIWDGLIADFQRLAEVIENNREAMNSTQGAPRERVPLDVVNSCSKLIMKLVNLQTSKMQSFMTAFAAAPGLRKRFSRRDDEGGFFDRILNKHQSVQLVATKWSQMRKFGAPTLVIGKLFGGSPGYQQHVQSFLLNFISYTVAEINWFVEHEEKDKELMTPFIRAFLSTLTMYGACLVQVRQYDIWNNNFDLIIDTQADELLEYINMEADPIANVANAIRSADYAHFGSYLLEGFGGLFQGPQTERNTPKRQATELKANGLWDIVIEALKANEIRLPMALQSAMEHPGGSTCDWEDRPAPAPAPGPARAPTPARAEPEAGPKWEAEVEVRGEPSAGSSDNNKRSAAEAGFDEEKEEEELKGKGKRKDKGKGKSREKDKEEEPKRKKIKTKGVADPARVVAAEKRPAAEEAPTERRNIKVSQRVLRTLQQIFFQEHVGGGHAGEVAWSDFRYAMTAIGFKITSLRGSVWNFQPPPAWKANSINFHSPHPKKGYSYTIARRIGKRLAMKYGLELSQFSLE